MRIFNSVWYFDATGGIHKPMKDKTIYFYSIACHDKERGNRSITPVAEFFTSSHTSDNIATYLSDIQNLISQHTGYKLKNGKEKSVSFLPKIIVTDCSWALITSVMKSINNCDVNHYLKYCFEILNPSLEKNDSQKVFSKYIIK